MGSECTTYSDFLCNSEVLGHTLQHHLQEKPQMLQDRRNKKRICLPLIQTSAYKAELYKVH